METILISVDNSMDNENVYEQAVDILKKGGVVSFPTETVYGLGAVATDEAAVRKIFEAKGRPSDNPLIVHIGNAEEVEEFATGITADAKKLMEAFWPGPLTLVFEMKPGRIAPNVTPGVETVGIRMPDHPVALRLLRALGEPVAAPSANRSGKPSPTEATHVLDDLDGLIPMILDGGRTGVGVESTVLDMTTVPPTILRPGNTTREMIEEVIGPVQIEVGEIEKAPRSPGMKYTHYAPDAPLFVIHPDGRKLEAAIQTLQSEGKKVAVVGPDEMQTDAAEWYFSIGSLHDHEAMASNLYRALRQCDMTKADIILAVETDLSGVGVAVMNRLIKAADGKQYSDRTE
ncbi:sua5/ycio/yrdc/ywlc family protein [Bacillus sp. OxB-1]|uniref:L-threonylcarbamoyladenylate synthase n=1 Tax=Bacillus sp. (strain OxB-1) TaxID=98228 RepID=UPI000581DCB7|nr:L-threonylcarbamoyladenylate synthase [Bacillus sp. OxB-1]BAQ09897.1 sua5/ycio/yrdc/ywlc family protein [Bacillus sp. OxB-1]